MPDIRRISYRYSLSILRQPRQRPSRGKAVRQSAAICQSLCHVRQYQTQNQGVVHACMQAPDRLWRQYNGQCDDKLPARFYTPPPIPRDEARQRAPILPETGLRSPRCLQERTLRRPHPATGETSQTRTGEEELSDRNGIEETDQPQAFRRVQQHPVDVPLFLHDRTALQRRAGPAMEGREAQRQTPSAGVPPTEDRHL